MNKVSETVVGTTENIKDGNEEIREVLVLTLSLLDAFFAVLVNVEASPGTVTASPGTVTVLWPAPCAM